MARISRLSSLNPLAISITWGAGGSTKDRSLELAGLTQAEGLSTILHLTCTNMEQGLVDDVLQVHRYFFFIVFSVQYFFEKAAKKQGIQNILALRGGRSLFTLLFLHVFYYV
jgi:methylenetetrahydrofolate reductase (NADPH)